MKYPFSIILDRYFHKNVQFNYNTRLICVYVYFSQKSLMQSKRSKKLEESAHFFVGNEKRADGQQKKDEKRRM